ncbi:MAG: hypothetical protein MZV70_47080 [Desulfobacterales bacterium]|nr:hypothetical protein [Desulfobacterales bacterium]
MHLPEGFHPRGPARSGMHTPQASPAPARAEYAAPRGRRQAPKSPDRPDRATT